MTVFRTIGEKVDGEWDERSTNGALIRHAASLGHIAKEDLVLDATWGGGLMWAEWQPDRLLINDLNGRKIAAFLADTSPLPAWLAGWSTHDFRAFPEDWKWWGKFDVVLFDPPYGLSGSRSDGNGDRNDRYGLDRYRTVGETHALILGGLMGCYTVAAPDANILVKIQDQVASNTLYTQARMVMNAAEMIGMKVADYMNLPGYRGQPEGRTQRTSQADYSTLVVLRKGRGPRRAKREEVNMRSDIIDAMGPQGDRKTIDEAKAIVDGTPAEADEAEAEQEAGEIVDPDAGENAPANDDTTEAEPDEVIMTPMTDGDQPDA